MADSSTNSPKPRRGQVNRRQFLMGMAKTACGVGVFGLGIGMYSRQANSLPALAIRPPGALPEEDFLAACTRCGLCVRDCPYQI
ncbi:MAG: ferredoxin-type protein NapG, partial [Gammaproteobacteria bacterium]|nr:ferredoxin-type protein NapG [Gammaproteobacteria bacterium]